jgi:UDP-N-acetylmuramoyl-L-alanyl-D-glutamate--2,6-diaminopimelate ligase
MFSWQNQALTDLRARLSSQVVLTSDSRALFKSEGRHYVWFVYPGDKVDLRAEIPVWLSRGLLAVVYESSGVESLLSQADLRNPRCIGISSLKQYSGEIARFLLDGVLERENLKWPRVVATTGTNGKTTVSHWVAQTLAWQQQAVAVGTVGVFYFGSKVEGLDQTQLIVNNQGLTTPDAVTWQQNCFEFAKQGVDWVSVEASSIGLDQKRLSGTSVEVAVFTNLTRDHLDYHQDMVAYAQAKAKLFQWPHLSVAVLNHDDDFGKQLINHAISAQAVVSYGLTEPNLNQGIKTTAIWLSIVEKNKNGYRVCLEQTGERGLMFDLPFVAKFQLYNWLAVLATHMGLKRGGLTEYEVTKITSLLHAVPGRLENISLNVEGGTSLVPQVLVDYAHTPDALKNVLLTTQEDVRLKKGRLWVVFGCGGNRDKGKRPRMMEVALKYADEVVITADNPRYENPESIVADMLSEINNFSEPPTHYRVVLDRLEAIELAIRQADANDVVVIAGKGHEDYQEIAGQRTPFSDQQVSFDVLKKRLSR